jgi:C4-dicarboxylate transporter DctQ subunit
VTKINEIILKFEEIVAVLLAFAMIAVIFTQVFSRSVLGNSLSWSEELGRYVFVWMTFIGASIALQRGAHLGIDVVVQMLPKKFQKALSLVTYILIFILIAIMVKEGFTLVERTSIQRSPAMQIPMSWAYMAIPVSAVLMAFHTAVKIISVFKEPIIASKGGNGA